MNSKRFAPTATGQRVRGRRLVSVCTTARATTSSAEPCAACWLIEIAIACSARPYLALPSSTSVERVTRIELAWPAWRVATAVLAGGHRVVRVRFQLTLDDCDSPCLMAR